MDSAEWGKLPELGIEEMDKEHREILDLMSTLRNALRSETRDVTERDVVSDVLEECARFIRNHFGTEETLMQQSLYPGYLDHKKEHELFLTRIIDLQKQVQAGAKSITIETLGLMGNWLHHHVLETDRPLVPHLIKTGLSFRPFNASENASASYDLLMSPETIHEISKKV